MEQSEPKIGWSGVEWSGAVRRSYRKTMQQSGARSGHRGVGMEWGAGLNYKKILGWGAERLFRLHPLAHMLW